MNAAETRTSVVKKPRTPHFIGWKGYAFHFRAPSGFKTKLTGPRASIVFQLTKLLPAWHKVAKDQGHDDLAADIEREAGDLGIGVSI